MNIYPIGNDLVVKWSLLYSDDTVFPLSRYEYELSYRTVRGSHVVTDTAVLTVAENLLTWSFKGKAQSVSGPYSLSLKITLSGSEIVTLNYDNAFVMSALRGVRPGMSVLNLVSYCDAIDLASAIIQARKSLDYALSAAELANSASQTSKTSDARSAEALTKAQEAVASASSSLAKAESAITTAGESATTSSKAAELASGAKAVADAAKAYVENVGNYLKDFGGLDPEGAEELATMALTVASHTTSIATLTANLNAEIQRSTLADQKTQGMTYVDGKYTFTTKVFMVEDIYKSTDVAQEHGVFKDIDNLRDGITDETDGFMTNEEVDNLFPRGSFSSSFNKNFNTEYL